MCSNILFHWKARDNKGFFILLNLHLTFEKVFRNHTTQFNEEMIVTQF